MGGGGEEEREEKKKERKTVLAMSCRKKNKKKYIYKNQQTESSADKQYASQEKYKTTFILYLTFRRLVLFSSSYTRVEHIRHTQKHAHIKMTCS